MPGRDVTDYQMRLFMNLGHSEGSRSRRPGSGSSSPRRRRRPDPLADIFDAEIVQMLEAEPVLRAIAIYEEMRRRHPDLPPGIRRTIERRGRGWRGEHGPEREVVFPRIHAPEQLALSDFTDCGNLGVTIAGVALHTGSITSGSRGAVLPMPI